MNDGGERIMKKNRATFWFVLWIISVSVGSLFSAVCEIFNYFKTDFLLKIPLYTDYQIILLLVFLPLCLIPLLCASCYYAVKEKQRTIKLVSICLIVHHAICVIAVLLQLLAT